MALLPHEGRGQLADWTLGGQLTAPAPGANSRPSGHPETRAPPSVAVAQRLGRPTRQRAFPKMSMRNRPPAHTFWGRGVHP